MKNSTVIEILKSLSKEELVRLGELVRSPYFNRKSSVIKLYDLLRKQAPAFADDKITKEQLWKKIYPGKTYNYGVMKNLIFELTRLTEEYLAVSRIDKKDYRQKFLIETLKSKRLDNILLEKLRKFRTRKKEGKTYLEQYEDSVFDYSLKTDFIFDNPEMLGDIQKEARHRIYSFTIAACKCIYYLHFNAKDDDTVHEITFFKALLKYYEDRNSEDEHPVVNLYCRVYRAMIEKDPGDEFSGTLALLNRLEDRLSRSDKRNIYLCIGAFYEGRFRDGIYKHEAAMLKLWIKIIHENLYSAREGEDLNILTYRNIFVLSVRNNTHENLEKYIEENVHKLPAEYRDALRCYSYAFYCFIKNDFKGTIEWNNRTVFTNITDDSVKVWTFKDDLKKMTIMSCYELGYYEDVAYQADSYAHFVKNSRFMPQRLKKSRMNFIAALKSLNQLNFNYTAKKEERLRRSIDKKWVDGEWFFKKISETSKRNSGRKAV